MYLDFEQVTEAIELNDHAIMVNWYQIWYYMYWHIFYNKAQDPKVCYNWEKNQGDLLKTKAKLIN